MAKYYVTVHLMQWVVLTALVVVCSVTAIILLGEDDGSTSLLEFFVLKVGAMLSVFGEYHISKWCANNNLIPAPVINYFNKCITNEEDEL